jgi:hypothetical protein
MHKSQMSRKAWNRLRLALFWARKGGRISSLTKLVATFRQLIGTSNDDKFITNYYYQEQEFSFDKSPIFHIKMRRSSSSLPFRFPCIHPNQVDFDDSNDDDDLFYLKNNGEAKQLFLTSNDDIVACDANDEGIDERAEEFIAKFYEQVYLQKQISD